MSQTENAVTSSSKEKRQYRKGNPLTDAEKQRQSIARKRVLLKEVKIFIDPRNKENLMRLCKLDGLTQAELLTVLIEREMRERQIS